MMRRVIRLLGEAQRSARDWRRAATTWQEGALKYQGMFAEERRERIWALQLSIHLLEEAQTKTGENTEEQRITLTAMVIALSGKPSG